MSILGNDVAKGTCNLYSADSVSAIEYWATCDVAADFSQGQLCLCKVEGWVSGLKG